MTQSDYEALYGATSALNDTDYTGIIPSTAQTKLDTLQGKQVEKLDRLAGAKLSTTDSYSQDKILGMTDSDSFNTENLGNTRTKIPGMDVYYDAIEGAHYQNGILNPEIDIYGKTVAERKAGVFGKSDRVMDVQRAEVARMLGKNVADVTQQDFIDVSNQQLIQKAANLGGSPDWEAPLIRGVEPTNLTGKYINDKGIVENIPLNIPVQSVGMGKDTSGKRELAAFGTADGTDVTVTDALNPNMNINANKLSFAGESNGTVDWNSMKMNQDTLDRDGMLGESLDIAQSSLIQQLGKTNKALRSMSRWAADSLGVNKETVDEWLPTLDKVGTIGFGDTPSTELARREVADKMTGVMAKTRKEQDIKMKSALENVKNGDYGKAGLDTLTIMPYILGDSAGEIASLMAGYPGIALAVASRVNEDAEEYERNNEGKKVDAKWLMGSTLSNLGVLVGEKLVVGKVLGGMTKGLSNTLAQKGKDVFYSTLGETAQEYADQTQQMYMTQKEGSKTLSEVATSPEAQLAALTGGAMGGVTSGTGFAGSAAVGAVDKGIQQLDEKIKYHSGTLDDPERVTKPIGMDGKFNMWDSVGHPDYKVTDPKAKEVHAETIAEFVVDLHTNPEAMVKYGYRGKVEDGGKNIGSALQDATDKMAAVYDLTSPKAKEVAKYMLVQKLVNYTRSKSTEKGEYKIDPATQQKLLKETAEFVKGNKLAEIAFLDMQEDEIKAVFESQVNIKKANEYLTSYGLDQSANGDIIANLKTLDDEQYTNLQKAIKSMKLMGSSDSVILERMDEIGQELDALRAETNILGSEDRGPTNGPNGPKQEKVKKTYLDVANEVKKIGFLTRKGLKKGAEQHSRDIENFVGVQGVPESVQTRHVDQLEGFVKHRGIDKVWPFVAVKGEKILNNLPGIKNILSNKIDENEDLINIMESKIEVLKKSKEHPNLLARFEKMRDDMYVNQGKHAEILQKANSEDPAIRREVYMDLNDTSTHLGKDVLNEMLDEPGKHWDSVPRYENIDTTNTERGVDTEPITGTERRQAMITELASRMVDGSPSSREDMVTYADHRAEIDAEVSKIREALNKPEETKPTKVMTGATQGTNDYKKVAKADATSGPYKAPIVVVPKTPLEDPTEAVLEDTPTEEYTPATRTTAQKMARLKDSVRKKLATEYADLEVRGTVTKSNEGKTVITKGTKKSPKEIMVETINKMAGLNESAKAELIDFANQLPEAVGTATSELQESERLKHNQKQISAIYNHNKILHEAINAKYQELRNVRSQSKNVAKQIRDLRLDLKTFANKIGEQQDKIKHVDKEIKRANGSLSAKLAGLIEDIVQSAKNTISALKGWITKYKKAFGAVEKEITMKKSTQKALKSQQATILRTIEALQNELLVPQTMQEKREYKLAQEMDSKAQYLDTKKEHNIRSAEARTIRSEIEKLLGPIAKENKVVANSLSALLSKGATTEELMIIMPTIIQKNENRVEMVEDAIATLNKFSRTRIQTHQLKTPWMWFPKQTETALGDNPLLSIKIDGKTYKFADLWEGEFGDGKDEVRKHVKRAMDVVSVVTLKDMLDLSMLSDDLMQDLIKGTFGSLFADIDASTLSYDDKQFRKFELENLLMEELKSGKIVPESTFITAAGNMLLEQLELKLSTEMEGQDRLNLIEALGTLVMNNLLPANEVINTTKVKVQNVVSKGSFRKDKNGIFKAMNKDEAEEVIQTSSASIRLMNLETITSPYKKDIRDAATVFEFASERRLEMVSDKPLTPDKKVRNSDTPMAPSQYEYLKRQSGIEHHINDEFLKHVEDAKRQALIEIGLADKTNKSVKQAQRELLVKAILGTVEEIAETEGPLTFKSVLAKYEAEKLTIERLLDTYDLVGTDGFYIGWATTIAGRNMMSNNMLNMQSSGISRFVTETRSEKGTQLILDPAVEMAKEEIEHLELAVAQAIGLDIDKGLAEDVLADLRKNYVHIEQKNGKFTAKIKNPHLKELVKDGKFKLFQLRELVNGDKNHDLGFNSKSIMHLVQAIDLINNIQKDGKKVIKTNLSIEADGITNGMMLVLMQLGLNEFTLSMLQKGGIYEVLTDDTGLKNHGEFLALDDSKDVYQTPEAKVEEVFKENGATKQWSQLTAAMDGMSWRNFLKDPVMTFIYGSSLKTIRKNMAKSLVIGNGYIKGALREGNLKELLELAGMTKDDVHVTYKQYKLAETGEYKLTDLVEGDDVNYGNPKFAHMEPADVNALIRAIDAKIGDHFEETFKEQFKEIIEFRQALKTIEEVNYTIFSAIFKQKAQDKLEVRLGKQIDKDEVLGSLKLEELVEIKKEMMDEGTYYGAKSAMEGGTVDYFKTEKSSDEYHRSETIKVTINTNNFQSATGGENRDYNVAIEEIISNIGAIGVTTTHNQDGTIMVEGQIHDVLNIYDALMMGADYKKNSEQIQKLNEVFYNTATQNSMIGNAIDKLKVMFTPENRALVGSGEFKKTLKHLQRIFENYDNAMIEEIATAVNHSIGKNVKTIHENRQKLAGKDMRIGQYAAATDVENKIYNKGTIAPTIPVAEGETETEVMEILNKALRWLMTGAETYQNTLKDESQKAKGTVKQLKAIEKILAPLEDPSADKASKAKAETVYNAIRETLGKDYAQSTNKEVFAAFKKQLKETC